LRELDRQEAPHQTSTNNSESTLRYGIHLELQTRYLLVDFATAFTKLN